MGRIDSINVCCYSQDPAGCDHYGGKLVSAHPEAESEQDHLRSGSNLGEH